MTLTYRNAFLWDPLKLLFLFSLLLPSKASLNSLPNAIAVIIILVVVIGTRTCSETATYPNSSYSRTPPQRPLSLCPQGSRLDQIEARRAEKVFWGHLPPPLSERLDPPLVWTGSTVDHWELGSSVNWLGLLCGHATIKLSSSSYLTSSFTYLLPGKTLSKASIIFQYGNFHFMNKVFNSYLHILTFAFCFKVEVMMEGIIQAFLDRVSGVGWIDNQTVEAVREKVRITHLGKNSSMIVMRPRSLILLACLLTLYFHFLFSKGVEVEKRKKVVFFFSRSALGVSRCRFLHKNFKRSVDRL